MDKHIRVLVCGYYGFGNSGDEAILSILIRDLGQRLDHPKVTVVGGSVEAIAADHRVDAVSWLDLPGIRDEAERSDLMVLGGGGLFQDQQSFDPSAILTSTHGGVSHWAGFALLSHLVKRPLAIYGVGVGPLTTDDGRRLTTVSFQAASAAAVRDSESAQLLGELGIHGVRITADPVFMMTADRGIGLEILAQEQIAVEAPRIAVAIRSWSDDGFVTQLAAQLDRLVTAHDAQILFIPLQNSPHRSENDPAIALKVLGQMKHPSRAVIVRGTYTPGDKMSMLATADVVIGMRLHSVVMAAAAGVPVVAMVYDPKVDNTMKALGASDLALGVEDLSSLADKVEWAMSEPSYQTAIAQKAEALAALAALNGQVLIDALNGPQRPGDSVDAEASAFALRQFETRAEADRLRGELDALTQRLHELNAAHLRLQEEWDHLVGSRSLRLVNSWWSLRNSLRRTPQAEHRPSETRKMLEKELSQVLDLHSEAAGIVVFPPTIGWSAHLFQRPQQMAMAFARMGYLAFYGVDWGGREEVRGFRYRGDRLCLMGVPTEDLLILRAIPNPLMMSYVYNFDFHRHLSEPTTVFEHIDHLEVFASSYTMEQLTAWYDVAIHKADVPVASARDLQIEMLPLRPDVVLCPNGVTFEHFAGHRPGPPPPDLEPLLSKPIIGYYGALAEWVDYELIDHAASTLTQFNFVFIGPNYDKTMDGKSVFNRPNVFWLGPKPYEELPAYLHHFSVATIPFHVNEVTHRVSPLKLFEYMAGGKPVVTTAMRESANYRPVLTANDPAEWVERLIEADGRSDDPELVATLQRTARANTWDQRVGTVIDAAARARRNSSTG
jgi:polysaccharide pyruvyl transferase CsaB